MTEQTASKEPQIRFKGFEGEWEEKALGDLFSITSAARVHKNEWTKSGVPFFRSSDVVSHFKGNENTKAFISNELYEELSAKVGRIKKGDMLVTGGGSIGIPYLVKTDEPLYFKDADLLWFKIREAVDSHYLYTFFSSEPFRRYLRGISHIGTIAHYTVEQAKSTPLSVPKNTTEQTQIGEYFRELDSLIGLHQRKHDKLVTLKKAMLQKMFPQPGATTPEIRFKGFEGDWVEKTLAEISEIKTGPFGSALHAKDYVSDGVPIITTEHFKYWQLPETKEGLPQVSNSDYERLKNYVLKHGDIVFSRVGSIDINAHVEEKQNGWLFSGRVLRVRTPLSIDSEYLHHELSTDRVRKSVVERAVGQTMPSINTGILGRTAVFLPEQKAEQQKIGSYFRTLDELISKHAIQLQKLQQVKSACLEKMFV